MRSQSYVITFVLVMTGLVALVLAGMNTSLKGIHSRNEMVYNRKAVLASIEGRLGIKASELSSTEVESLFDSKIKKLTISTDGEILDGVDPESLNLKNEKKKSTEERRLPLYIYEDGTEKYYIIYVRGSGLWDEIWGNIALEQDLNTIAGASFDHTGETPGLGAEIKDNPAFPAQFEGKKLYDASGEYQSVAVVKGGIRKPDHQVDAISGATITGNGVTTMLDKGINLYVPYLSNIKSK